ncbi:MAG: hypothetical protein JWO03_1711 [Bacteroidetes bacterium]|nr:hypothetical protein [Bacteroidota bacterium]
MRKYICSNRLVTQPCSLRLAGTITMGSDDAQLKCKECNSELEPLEENTSPQPPSRVWKYAGISLAVLVIMVVAVLFIEHNKNSTVDTLTAKPEEKIQDQTVTSKATDTSGKHADQKQYYIPSPSKPDPAHSRDKMTLTTIQHFFDDLSGGPAPYSAKSDLLKSGVERFFTSPEARIATLGKNHTQTDEMSASDFGELLCTSGQRYFFVGGELEGTRYSKVYVTAQ